MLRLDDIMDLRTFWDIIEPGKDEEAPEESLRCRLEALQPGELVWFQEHFDALHAAAYRWDIWGAAYLLEGGCSDDGFIDFRYALISLGREVYEAALANADSLADVPIVPNEIFGYVAGEVYEEVTRQEMPRQALAQPHEPEGQRWDFDNAEECARRLPRLAVRSVRG